MPFVFANPAGLWALLALPAIVGLHLLHRRHRPRRVAGLFLWRATGPDPAGGRRVDRLRNRVSLWVELLLAALLALLLADPRFDRGLARRHLLIVLDDRASLSARARDRDTREAAVRAVRELLAAESVPPAVTLIRSGEAPRLLVGPAGSVPDAERALATWRPERREHSLRPALELARELHGERTVLWLISDRLPDSGEVPGSVRAVGQAAPNAAWTTVRRLPGPEGERVFGLVRGFAARPLTRRAVLTDSQGAVLAETTLPAGPEGSRVELKVPAGREAESLLLRLEPGDALSLDDEVLLPPRPRRVVSYHVALPDGAEREAARRALEAAGSVETGLATREVETAEAADLLVARADRPLSRPGLRLLPRPEREPGSEEGDEALLGPFLSDPQHPLTRGLGSEGLIWAGSRPGALPGDPLLLADDRVLLALAGPEVVLNGELAGGNLTRHPAWPVLIANLVERARAGLPGLEVSLLRAGEEARLLPIPGTRVEPATLRGPRGEERPLRPDARGVLRTGPLERPGRYEIRRDGRSLAELSVYLGDPGASDLRRARGGERLAPAVAAPERLPAAGLLDRGAHLVGLGAILLAFLAHLALHRPRRSR
jgi:hypothetical protein